MDICGGPVVGFPIHQVACAAVLVGCFQIPVRGSGPKNPDTFLVHLVFPKNNTGGIILLYS